MSKIAVPDLHSLHECADFSLTVAPFIPQLYALPEKLADAFGGRHGGGFVELYTATNPVISGFAVSLLFGAAFLVASEINRNYSQVDRFWSLLPTFYIAHFDLWARLNGFPSQRLDAALFFGTIWSIRLTYNYWRKGGYDIGSEDYRWEIVRRQMPSWAFALLNWTFISFMQSALLYGLALPVYAVLLATRFEPNLSSADVMFMAAELGLVAVEVIADQQQWNYQNAKHEYRATGKVPRGYTQADLDRGFLTSGLWAYSRHPNFAAEQAIWVVLYQWSCFATKSFYGWAGAGAVFLLLLFQGSTALTETITTGKYPAYREYQRSVGVFAPTRLSPYGASSGKSAGSSGGPKVIRTSELAEKMKEKQK